MTEEQQTILRCRGQIVRSSSPRSDGYAPRTTAQSDSRLLSLAPAILAPAILAPVILAPVILAPVPFALSAQCATRS
jgi:hypothetical protein